MAYLVGFAACLLGIIRAIVAIRWFLREARAGRMIEGKELLNFGVTPVLWECVPRIVEK